MTFNPKEWRKLSERQRRAVIRKIEREEKRAKTVMVVMVIILVFALLLSLFAVMSSCPTPQDTTPTGRKRETQAQHKPGLACDPALSLRGIEARVMVGFGAASNPLVTPLAFVESLFRT
jgi:hypothetical protein